MIPGTIEDWKKALKESKPGSDPSTWNWHKCEVVE